MAHSSSENLLEMFAHLQNKLLTIQSFTVGSNNFPLPSLWGYREGNTP